jgi:hypothetical protein
MANSKIELRGYIESLPDGSVSLAPTPMVNLTSPVEVQSAILVVGDNSSTPAPDSIGVLITLPVATTTNSRVLKAETLNSGFALPPLGGFIVLPFNPSSLPPAVIITLTTSADTLPTTFRYF